jgi:peptidoglycan/xylan/chitin deacetylase (PgdA/CDA1 family)
MFIPVSIAIHLALVAFLIGRPGLLLPLLGGYAAYHAVVAWGILYPRSRLFGPNLARLPTTEPIVMLTFDDGPHPEVTPRVLDILRAHGARASFFLIGKWVERYPEVVQRIVQEGHTVGCHSYTHSYLFWALSPLRLTREVRRSRQAIEMITGRPCLWFRAPVGLKNCFLGRVLAREGMRLVSWGISVRRSERPAAGGLPPRLAGRLRPGSILLLHDGHDRRPEGSPGVLETLPGVLASLRTLGYRSESLP